MRKWPSRKSDFALLFAIVSVRIALIVPFLISRIVRKRKPKYTYISTGGTGGHVIPAGMVHRSMQNSIFILDERGIKYVLPSDIIFQIPVKSLNHKSAALWMLASIGLVFIKFCKDQPKVVLGFGGYAAFPTLIVAAALNIPIVLHEQNAVAGLVTNVFAPLARAVLTTFPKTKGVEDPIVTGMPIRYGIANDGIKMYESTVANGSHHIVLITSGSGGAEFFSKQIPEAIAILATLAKKPLMVYHQAKPHDVERVTNFYAERGIKAHVSPFFIDLPKLLQNASIAISRGGASSVVEIAQSGVPGIFIPLPSAKNDHQNANIDAIKYSDNSFCSSFTEESISQNPYKLGIVAATILENQGLYESMSRGGRLFFNQNAIESICSVLYKI